MVIKQTKAFKDKILFIKLTQQSYTHKCTLK